MNTNEGPKKPKAGAPERYFSDNASLYEYHTKTAELLRGGLRKGLDKVVGEVAGHGKKDIELLLKEMLRVKDAKWAWYLLDDSYYQKQFSAEQRDNLLTLAAEVKNPEIAMRVLRLWHPKLTTEQNANLFAVVLTEPKMAYKLLDEQQHHEYLDAINTDKEKYPSIPFLTTEQREQLIKTIIEADDTNLSYNALIYISNYRQPNHLFFTNEEIDKLRDSAMRGMKIEERQRLEGIANRARPK